MSDLSLSNNIQVLRGFLAYLREQGFKIRIDQYIRIQILLERVDVHSPPSSLKYLLCPIFATNVEQQENFYRVFDAYADTLLRIAPPPPPPPDKISIKKLIIVLTSLIAITTLIFIALYLFPREGTPIQQNSNTASANTSYSNNTNAAGNLNTAFNFNSQTTSNIAANTNINSNIAENSNQSSSGRDPDANQESKFNLLSAILLMAIILIPLISYLLYELYLTKQRQLELREQLTKKPPYTWPLRFAASTPRPYDSEKFYKLSRIMRRRQSDQFQQLDLAATVTATIKSFGYPNFRYKSASKPPEYLILIDQLSHRDHQAQLFYELTKALADEGIFVVSFFFRGDPRVCYSEKSKSRILLTELHHKYPGHRLIIFGDGEKLIDPLTGLLASWAHIFSEWKDRAILSLAAMSSFGRREAILSTHFVLKPATLDGLHSAIEYFDSQLPGKLRTSAKYRLAPELDALNINRLRSYLGEEIFQWLCACAVYPELHWDLTLNLGSPPCFKHSLITEKNFLLLLRLPWFRKGLMPDSIRWELMKELDPTRVSLIRSEIIKLLETNPPPENLRGTFAVDSYRLTLKAQQWLLHSEEAYFEEMLQLFKKLPESQSDRDPTLLQFIRSKKHPILERVLPIRIRDFLFVKGVPSFGFSKVARAIAAFIPLVVVGTAIAFSYYFPSNSSTPTPNTNSSIANNANTFPNTNLNTATNANTSPNTNVNANSNANTNLIGCYCVCSGDGIHRYLGMMTATQCKSICSGPCGPMNANASATINGNATNINTNVNSNTNTRANSNQGPNTNSNRNPSGEITTGTPDVGTSTTRTPPPETVLPPGGLRSPDKKLYATISEKEVKIWDTERGLLLFTLQGHTSFVTTIAFSPDERLLASASVDGTVMIWDIKSANLLRTLRHDRAVMNVSFISDGGIIRAVTKEGKVHFWDLRTGLLRGESGGAVTSDKCPKVTINVSKGKDYRFTAVVEGGEALSQPKFTWRAIWRDQQGQSRLNVPLDFEGQGKSSILIRAKELADVDVLTVEVTVTGYDPSCKASAGVDEVP